jgi:L-fuconolactonase
MTMTAQLLPFPVVDLHNHVIADDPQRFPLDPMGGKQSDWSRERPVNAAGMLKAMQEAGVQQSVLVQASTCYGHDNRYVVDCVRQQPRAFAGVFSVDFMSPDGPERIAHWMEQGLSGVRVFVAGHTAADSSVRLDDPRAAPTWQHLAETGIPVSVQLRSHGLPQLEAVIARFPRVRILLDHCARPELGDGPPYAQADALFALARHPSLHLKYTTHNVRESAQGRATQASFCRTLVDRFGAQRIAWGSNFPASSGSLLELLQEALVATETLTATERTAIFGGTARALYPALEAA